MQNAILSGESLKEQILKFHAQSVKNGFYDDYPTQESRQTEEYICSRAMLIAGEIAEAYEAHREGRIDVSADVFNTLQSILDAQKLPIYADVQGLPSYADAYKAYVKGTVAEELADTYIRLCCVAGSVEIYDAPDLAQELANLKEETKKSGIHGLFFEALQAMKLSGYAYIKPSGYKYLHKEDITRALSCVYLLADYLQIDLHRHVELKHLYNTTREYKHGKNY